MAPAFEHRTKQIRQLAQQYLIGGGKLKSHKLIRNTGGVTSLSLIETTRGKKSMS